MKKLANCVSTFTVWQDDEANKENVDPQNGKASKKPILKLHKFLIRDMSIEVCAMVSLCTFTTPEVEKI